MILYIDAAAGLSGDMLFSGFLDLGLSLGSVRRMLHHLGLSGIRVLATRIRREGTWATRVSSQGKGDPSLLHSPHRLIQWVKRSKLSPSVQKSMVRAVVTLADAEGRVHHSSLKNTVFHQVGSVDTLVNFTGFCAGLHHFRIRDAYCSPIPLGYRYQDANGRWRSTPGPATQRLLKKFPTYGLEEPFEWTTPTGAALVAAFGSVGQPPVFQVGGIGQSVGFKRPPHGPTVLRLFLGYPKSCA